MKYIFGLSSQWGQVARYVMSRLHNRRVSSEVSICVSFDLWLWTGSEISNQSMLGNWVCRGNFQINMGCVCNRAA